jgi:molybdenum cofactor cytidylyltransferase
MHCAIVLAAGKSRRMGRQKLLLPIGGVPTIARVVDALLASPIDQVSIVVGADRAAIAAALEGREVQFVVNEEPDSDMLDSIRCGLAAVPNNCDAVLVALGDQPHLEAEIITKLLSAFGKASSIVVPTFEGRRGHPIVFSTSHLAEIMTHYDGVGLRGLLAAHPDETHEVEVTSSSVLEDMDEPHDYDRLTSKD